MEDSASDLVGINEIAQMAGRSRQAVANWRARNTDFPEPVVRLASGPVFRRSHIRSWLRKRKIPMAHVFSTINLKGGVGKTTTTVALAEFMSGRLDKRVLIVDLDPQTNATVMLIGEVKWRKLNGKEHTICRLYKLARIISDEAKRNPEFAEELRTVLEPPAKARRNSKDSRKRSTAAGISRPANRRPPAVLDPVALAQRGEEALRTALSSLSLEQLKDIVADYGMDQKKLVMKWKTPSRVIDRIVEVSISRAQKGDAFLS